MAALSEKQLGSLTALWSGLTPALRSQLVAAAGPSGKLADVFALLDAELPAAPDDKVRAKLFRIFSDVTGSADLPPTHARFSTADLEALYNLAELDQIEVPKDLGDQKAAGRWREEAAAAVERLAERSENEKAVRRQLDETFGKGFKALLADAACLLQNDQVLHTALKPFPEQIGDVTPEIVNRARDTYDEICNDAPSASLWFLKILTARLEKTAQIFRIVAKIGGRADDSLVSRTDLADIGDLVLANADFHASKFLKSPQTMEEARQAGDAVAAFVKVSVGMTREFGIRKDGHWGKTLFAIRAKASAALEDFFKQVEKTVPRAIPHPVKGQRGLAKPGPMPKPEAAAQAEASLCFLAATSDWASQAAVGSSQKHAADLVRAEMDECVRDLLEVLRAAEGEEAERAAEAIELIVRYMRAFNDEENAELIQRRSVAVRANAA
ncbi:hypothetical protein V0U79_11845 [Hyphobacterium sp. HN65]|uniref:Uncharacterized protein n=1 Tax=Hyphobacterium lacteum TaxID=3116575 RepID=A0ABU7LT41_9PROT|nr:hypothetical protein [Hyphobacterium sp. HN65]MEE2527062.1 hypothetical protein [Hyphobacterium sp. HN65]